MRLMGIEAVYQPPCTSRPAPQHRMYPYLLRGLVIERVNQVWACRHLLHPDGPRVSLSGGGHGLGEPRGAELAIVQHDGRFVLCLGA